MNGMGARPYDPTSGRFLSPDPLGHGATLDLFSYAAGDPIRFDPSGRCVEKASSYQPTPVPNKPVSQMTPEEQKALARKRAFQKGTFIAEELYWIEGRANYEKSKASQVSTGGDTNSWGPRTDLPPGVDPLEPAPEYKREGSELGNGLAEIPILGYPLGPLGDLASGIVNIFTGNLNRGIHQMAYGVGDFLGTTARDAWAFAFGMTYGKGQAVVFGIQTLIDPGKKGRDYRALPLAVLIPDYDAMLGANWGLDRSRGQDNTSIMGHTRLDYASRNHDFNCWVASEKGESSMGKYHAQWNREAWFGPGSEPGVFGQAIRLIGTPAFYIFSKTD